MTPSHTYIHVHTTFMYVVHTTYHLCYACVPHLYYTHTVRVLRTTDTVHIHIHRKKINFNLNCHLYNLHPHGFQHSFHLSGHLHPLEIYLLAIGCLLAWGQVRHLKFRIIDCSCKVRMEHTGAVANLLAKRGKLFDKFLWSRTSCHCQVLVVHGDDE